MLKFIIKDGERCQSFQDLVRKYLMFPGSFGYTPPVDEPTDQPRGQSDQHIVAVPGDTVGITLGGGPRRMFTIPKGKKATKIKYTYEIELEDLPKCDECHGSGQISLFTTVETCGGCNGSGYKRS